MEFIEELRKFVIDNMPSDITEFKFSYKLECGKEEGYTIKMMGSDET